MPTSRPQRGLSQVDSDQDMIELCVPSDMPWVVQQKKNGDVVRTQGLWYPPLLPAKSDIGRLVLQSLALDF